MSPNKAHVPYTPRPLSPHIPVPTLSHSYRDKGDVQVGDQGASSNPQNDRLADKRYIVTTLGDVTRCDPDVTAWIASVRARFPGARPLHGKSVAGEIGRDWWAVAKPWREVFP